MNKKELIELIKQKQSFLCVGLDPDLTKLPLFLLDSEEPYYDFNKAIIDATLPYAIAYKPNLAFYEALGLEGWTALVKTVKYIRSLNKPVFLIADAKRGDIGNTSLMYARAFYEKMDFDAITLSPYMGKDTVSPFMRYYDKWSIILALTSNKSAADFQYFENNNGDKLFEKVISSSKEWGSDENIMYVVGATKAESFAGIRKIIPDHFLLVPGVGAQGGSLQEVAKYGMNKDCGLLVNSSRGIIYASEEEDFAEKAGKAAKEMQTEMKALLKEHKII